MKNGQMDRRTMDNDQSDTYNTLPQSCGVVEKDMEMTTF